MCQKIISFFILISFLFPSWAGKGAQRQCCESPVLLAPRNFLSNPDLSPNGKKPDSRQKEIAEGIALAQTAVVLRKICHDTNGTLSELLVFSSSITTPNAPPNIRQFTSLAEQLSNELSSFAVSLRQSGYARAQNYFFNDGFDLHEPKHNPEKILQMAPILKETFAAARRPGGFLESVNRKLDQMEKLLKDIVKELPPNDWKVKIASEGLEEIKNQKLPAIQSILAWTDPGEKINLLHFKAALKELCEWLNNVKWVAHFEELHFNFVEVRAVELEKCEEMNVDVDVRPVLTTLLSFVATVYDKPSAGKKEVYLRLTAREGKILLVIEAEKQVSSGNGYPFLAWAAENARRAKAKLETGPMIPLGFQTTLWLNTVAVPGTAVAKKRDVEGPLSTPQAESPDLFPTEWAIPPPRASVRRVLIVDDEKIIRTLMKIHLNEMNLRNVEIREAEDGTVGLRVYGEWHPHLILTDLSMRHMSGAEMVCQIRDLPGGANVKIVLVTGNAMNGYTAGDLGVEEILAKPFRFEQIEAIVKRYLPSLPPQNFAVWETHLAEVEFSL